MVRFVVFLGSKTKRWGVNLLAVMVLIHLKRKFWMLHDPIEALLRIEVSLLAAP